MYAPDGTPIPKDIEAEVKHILDAPRDRGIVHPDTSEWDRAFAFVRNHGTPGAPFGMTARGYAFAADLATEGDGLTNPRVDGVRIGRPGLTDERG